MFVVCHFVQKVVVAHILFEAVHHPVNDGGMRSQTAVPPLVLTFGHCYILCPALVFGAVSAVAEIFTNGRCKNVLYALHAELIDKFGNKAVFQTHSVEVFGNGFVDSLSALLALPVRYAILFDLVVLNGILRGVEIDSSLFFFCHRICMIMLAIVLDKLCGIRSRIQACILVPDKIVIQFRQNTSAILIQCPVMLFFQITVFRTRIDDIFQLGKDVNLVILVKNIFRRTG